MDAQKKMDIGSVYFMEEKKLAIWKELLFSCILPNISRVAKLLKLKLWCLVTCIYYTQKYVPLFRPSYCWVSSR